MLQETNDLNIEIDEFVLSNDHCSQASEGYSDNVQMALMELESLLVQLSSTNILHEDVGKASTLPKLRLPQVPFPEFDGKPEMYRGFIDSMSPY